MLKKFAALFTLSAGVAGIALTTAPAVSQNAAPEPARYTMDASTVSGMGAMGSGAGAMMRMMAGGGGGGEVRQLDLRLGSPRAPTGAPKADHFMPQGARLGTSVPLLTPKPTSRERVPDGPMRDFERPKGRLLLYWGCGEKAPAGQPVVIDFAKMAAGQMPPDVFASGISEDWQVYAHNSRTFGEWPNEKDSKTVANNASLLGSHKVTSSYAPDIAFTLADDFMPALKPRSAALSSGAWRLDWNALPKATGYYAWAMGSSGNNDMVWWSSSASRQFGGALAGWIAPATVARLVTQKTVMPATQTSCAIPAEVRKAGGEVLMTQLFAYGPQAEFSYPARPANARAGWKPDWIARARFRSNAGIMLGMDMGEGQAQADGSTPPAESGKPKCKRGLAGIAQRAAGLCQ